MYLVQLWTHEDLINNGHKRVYKFQFQGIEAEHNRRFNALTVKVK